MTDESKTYTLPHYVSQGKEFFVDVHDTAKLEDVKFEIKLNLEKKEKE